MKTIGYAVFKRGYIFNDGKTAKCHVNRYDQRTAIEINQIIYMLNKAALNFMLTNYRVSLTVNLIKQTP